MGWVLELHRKKKNSPLWRFPSVALDQLWSQKLIDLFPLKILEVEWDWWQSLGSVNMGPWWPDGIWTAPSGPVIRMLCVITRSTMDGVKTQLVRKGQASNILGDLWFSLRGSWTCNLSTLVEFKSYWPVENTVSINHYLKPSIQWQQIWSVNVLSSWTILFFFSYQNKRKVFSFSINDFVKADQAWFIWECLQYPPKLVYKTSSTWREFFVKLQFFWGGEGGVSSLQSPIHFNYKWWLCLIFLNTAMFVNFCYWELWRETDRIRALSSKMCPDMHS